MHVLAILCRDLRGAWPELEGRPAAVTADAVAAAARKREALLVWQQQAAPLFTAFEAFARDVTSTSAPADIFKVIECAFMCCANRHSKPLLLLRLARDGSSEQQVAFFNLLVSLLKLSRTCDLRFGVNDSAPFQTTIATAAFILLSASGGADGSPAGGGSSDGCARLWLLVLGRCCLLLAEALQHVGSQRGSWVQVMRDVDDIRFASWFLKGHPTQLSMFLRDLAKLFSDVSSSSLSASLLAAGYSLDAIMDGFGALVTCYPELADIEGVPAAVVDERVGGLIKALVSLGEALSMFAVPHCCNNPGCRNLGGLSEASIVSGKGCVCAGCKVARYCGKPCHVAHWKMAHKRVCKVLAASKR
jgi:hypothetical protein